MLLYFELENIPEGDMAGVFELLDKLITEHGSAAILREHIGLIKAQYAALEGANKDLQLKLNNAQAEIDKLRAQHQQASGKLQAREASNPKGYACDGCGSTLLKRTGARPDRVFGDLGGKQVKFNCLDCGADSEFLEG